MNISPLLILSIGCTSFVFFVVTLPIVLVDGFTSAAIDQRERRWAAFSLLCAIVMPICAYMEFNHQVQVEESFQNAKLEQVRFVDAEKKSGGKTTYWAVTVEHTDTGLRHQMSFYKCAGDWPQGSEPVNIVRSTEGKFRFPGCREDPYNSLANIWKYWWLYASFLFLSGLALARPLLLPVGHKHF
jgi:hypothetical protein